MNVLLRVYNTLFRTIQRHDLSAWDHPVNTDKPIYGVYHVFCADGWELLVNAQVQRLRASGLLDASAKFYVSCITLHEGDVDTLKKIVNSDKLEIISIDNNPKVFEYPALEFLREKSDHEECLFYYFHTKGVSFFTKKRKDHCFAKFKRRVNAWRLLMEYFLMDKWQVAVNILLDGYDTYGCNRYPPKPAPYRMYAGNFWWASSKYIRTLPYLDRRELQHNRFYAEDWLYEGHIDEIKDFSAFDTVAQLYRVYMPPVFYESNKLHLFTMIKFVYRYNMVKIRKNIFNYNYDNHLNHKYQKT
ncbi:MAG: hypothetical protein RBR72_00390 [Prevotella sp.]|jgi:hypothetical protein|nr:hypothetical protein [Prevotella sp.]